MSAENMEHGVSKRNVFSITAYIEGKVLLPHHYACDPRSYL
jgi:hypothetical protein